MTPAQEKLIARINENGGSLEVVGRGEKVVARGLMRQGLLILTGVGIYSLP